MKTTQKTTTKTVEKNAVENILSIHRWNHEDKVCYRTRSSKPLSEKAYASIVAAQKQAAEHGRLYDGNEVITYGEEPNAVHYEVYQTLLVNGKAICCSCPATKPCYHETQLEAHETTAKPVADIRCAQREIAREQANEQASTTDVDESNEEATVSRWANEDLMMHAALNGNRRNERILPPQMAEAPTTRKIDMKYFMRA